MIRVPHSVVEEFNDEQDQPRQRAGRNNNMPPQDERNHDEHTDVSIHQQIEAEIQVEAFIRILEKRFSVASDEIPEFLAELRRLRKRSANLDRILWSVALAVLFVAVSGFLATVMEGVKSVVHSWNSLPK